MEQEGRAPLALVVEDDALLALELEAFLAAEGFESRIVCSGADALSLVPDHFALAVVNLRLDDGLLGRDVIGQLRRRQPNLPVVVVTGYGGTAPQADLRGLGWPTIRLHKPLQGGALGSAAREVLARARAGQPPMRRRRREDHGPQPGLT